MGAILTPDPTPCMPPLDVYPSPNGSSFGVLIRSPYDDVVVLFDDAGEMEIGRRPLLTIEFLGLAVGVGVVAETKAGAGRRFGVLGVRVFDSGA